jgi:hypothetical protein
LRRALWVGGMAWLFAIPVRAEAPPEWIGDITLPNAVAVAIGQSVAAFQADLGTLRAGCVANVGSDWFEESELTFAGPAFVSVVFTTGYSCAGAAHPDGWQETMTFDAETGARVDWSALLTALDGPAPDDRAVGASPLLQSAYLAAVAPVPEECDAALSDPSLRFDLWLDGKAGAVMASPNGLSHAERACGDIAVLNVDRLRALNPDPRLLSALAAGR